MLAPATTAPVMSVTTPVIVPLVDCPYANTAASIATPAIPHFNVIEALSSGRGRTQRPDVKPLKHGGAIPDAAYGRGSLRETDRVCAVGFGCVNVSHVRRDVRRQGRLNSPEM